jgi:phospholipid N-methyltransferase
MSKLAFFKEGIVNMRTTGSVVRSSKYLCLGMIKPVDFTKANVIVELGAGDGVLTHYILNRMNADAVLLCFEINPKFCEVLKKITDPRFHLIEDSAEHVTQYLKKHELEHIDYVISAIPFVALPDELSRKIVEGCYSNLRKGGLYIQFHYTVMIRKMYKSVFGNVKISFIPLNFPPAFVMVCEKK